MLKIIGKDSSIKVRKVLWTCAELGQCVAREAQRPGFREFGRNGIA